MKKDEITRVRLLSLAVLMALSLFILLVPIGSNEFAQIISKMNNNALNIPKARIQYISVLLYRLLMLFLSVVLFTYNSFYEKQCLCRNPF